MTKLSIFLYVADVLDNLSDIITGFCVATVLSVIIAVIVWSVNAAEPTAFTDEDKKDNTLTKFFRNTYKRMVIICIACLVVFFGGRAIIPTKQTMYMIAGVEMVDSFAKSDTGKFLTTETKSVISDITSIIHSYAEEKTGGKKERKDQ